MAKTWLGHLMVELFSERMLSNTKIVLTPGNMRLNLVEIEQLVVFCMNPEFVAYCKEHLPHELAAYVKALKSRTETNFMKALMAEQRIIISDPQPVAGIFEEDINGLQVTSVRINEPY